MNRDHNINQNIPFNTETHLKTETMNVGKTEEHGLVIEIGLVQKHNYKTDMQSIKKS